MRYYLDCTQSDIAERIGISQVQVSRLEKKILAQLKSWMSAQPEESDSKSEDGLKTWKSYFRSLKDGEEWFYNRFGKRQDVRCDGADLYTYGICLFCSCTLTVLLTGLPSRPY